MSFSTSLPSLFLPRRHKKFENHVLKKLFGAFTVWGFIMTFRYSRTTSCIWRESRVIQVNQVRKRRKERLSYDNVHASRVEKTRREKEKWRRE